MCNNEQETPIRVTFASYVMTDSADEGVIVRHNGQIVWQENNWGYIDQYLRFHKPKGPVLIEYGEMEELVYSDLP